VNLHCDLAQVDPKSMQDPRIQYMPPAVVAMSWAALVKDAQANLDVGRAARCSKTAFVSLANFIAPA
jgi:hypothetical protein